MEHRERISSLPPRSLPAIWGITTLYGPADASLRRLGTDYIDLYQIHFPSTRVPIAETMGAMESLVDQGKIRFIGVSNFSTTQLIAAQQSMTRHPCGVQSGAV